MLTNWILAQNLEISLYLVRRWTKQFLPPDLKATRRSGYAREFSLNDGFFIFLGGYLVKKIECTYDTARQILQALKPRLSAIGLVPEIPTHAKRTGVDALINTHYDVHAYRVGKSDWHFLAETRLKVKTVRKKDSFGKEYYEKDLKVARYWLGAPPPDIIKEAFETVGTTIILPVGALLQEFNSSIFNGKEFKAWGEKWDSILVGKPK